MRRRVIAISLVVTLSGFAAERTFAPYASVKPILDGFVGQIPEALKHADAAGWNAWSREEDRAIRARLERGELDSMVNLLLFGTAFTHSPRIQIQGLADASKNGTLRARVNDLVQSLRFPSTNERLIFLRSLLRARGKDPQVAPDQAGMFLLENLGRVLRENAKFAQRIAQGNRQGESRSEVFRDRGVSLDTSILPDFGVEETLRVMNERGVLGEGTVARLAVIGPGLDFADWDEGYDYYPVQTLQPFALYSSLAKLGLSKSGVSKITVIDISPRVLDHLQRARDRAKQGEGYTVQLPRSSTRQWSRAALNFWSTFGDRAGIAVPPIHPPAPLAGVETRAVRIRPEVVLACEPADVNIVLERLNLDSGERFDIVVATNVFVYYEKFEQALALENVVAMLKPGGFLLSNDQLPEFPGAPLALAGSTTVWYSELPRAGDSVRWYRKRPN